jgi:hypothetical protein
MERPFITVSTSRLSRRLLLACAVLLAPVAGARAEVAALVEDISNPRPGVEFMDYLNAGQMIPLAAGERLILDYVKSCVRDTIVGGIVSIGAEKSIVVGGTLTSETVECNGGKSQLSAEQASKSGVMIFRGILLKDASSSGSTASEDPPILNSTSPVFELTSGGRLVIERLDKPGERHVVEIPGTRRAIYDCAKSGVALVPGGTYRATSHGHEVTFKLAVTAKPGTGPLFGRLLTL